MARDIRKLLEDYQEQPSVLKEGHEQRFAAKLERAKENKLSENIYKENKGIINKSFWLKAVAILAIFLGVGLIGYMRLNNPDMAPVGTEKNAIVNTDALKIEEDVPQITLADISPDLKRVEEYYMTGINVQLASLKINSENKDLVDGYMERLSELDKEYSALNVELSKVGPTETTISALVDNLKFRLELLNKLKNKLKELKTQNNDDFKAIES